MKLTKKEKVRKIPKSHLSTIFATFLKIFAGVFFNFQMTKYTELQPNLIPKRIFVWSLDVDFTNFSGLAGQFCLDLRLESYTYKNNNWIIDSNNKQLQVQLVLGQSTFRQLAFQHGLIKKVLTYSAVKNDIGNITKCYIF